MAGRGDEPRGEPVQVNIEGLERARCEISRRGGERAARTERKQMGLVARGAKRPGEEDRLTLGAAAAEAILHDKNFHCGVSRLSEDDVIG